MSTSSSRRSLSLIASAPEKLQTEEVFALCFPTASGSRPDSHIRQPLRVADGDDLGAEHGFGEAGRIVAGVAVTLDGDGGLGQIDSQLLGRLADRVESRLSRWRRLDPAEPPTARGFPVMTPNWFLPEIFEYSSIIQAIIWGLV